MKKIIEFLKERRREKLLPLFLTESFRSVSVSLLSFFSAIYVYRSQLAATGNQKLAVISAFIFFLILYVFKLIGTCSAENLSQKMGLKGQVTIGNILTTLTIVGFLLSLKHFSFIWLTSVIWGLAIGFFWFGRHGLIAKFSTTGSYGEALGWASIINTVILLGVPFLGGVLISSFGYDSMFIASFVFMIISFLSLLKVKEEKTHKDTTVIEIIKLFSTHKRMSLAYFSSGFTGAVYSSALILFIFLTIGKESGFGSFFSLSMIVVAITNMLVGRWVDKRGKKALIVYGSILAGLIWFGRFSVASIIAFFIFDVIDRISAGMIGIPLGVLSYQKAIDGHSTGKAILFRESAITLGGIIGALLTIFVVAFNLPLVISFLVTALVALLPLSIIRKNGICGEVTSPLREEA